LRLASGVVEGVLHGLPDRGLDDGGDIGVHVGADADAGERHRQAGLALPPFTEIGALHESVVRVGESALVDDKPGVDHAAGDGAKDLVAAQLDGLDRGRRGQAEQPVRRGVAAGGSDSTAHRRVERLRTAPGFGPWAS
jgi:hypothetical protein